MHARHLCGALLSATLACTSTPASPETATTASTASLETETSGPSSSEATSAQPDLGPADPDLPSPSGAECEALEALVSRIDPGAPDQALAQVDAFIETELYGEHGFPLVEDQRLCVVYRGEDAGGVAVAGDFNGWDPSAAPLLSPVSGFAYAIVELDAEPSGLYKFVHPGEEFRADPLARRFGWDGFGEYSQIDPIPGRSHHERWPGFAEGLGALAPRELVVWLPPDAELETDALPVLYMHDGQNLFSPEALFGGWQVSASLDEAIAAELVAPVLVVGVANTPARMDEYTPVEDLIQGMLVGGRADEYADFLVGGVVPFIEARYPVSSDAADNAVMGSSLGGLVSLYIGQRHPEHFAALASLSGTVAWGSLGRDNPTILDAYASDPPAGLRIYLDSGGDPGVGCPEGGFDNYCANVELAALLRELGWVDELDLFYRWDPGAPHNEAAWAGRLIPALIDWFPGPPS